MRQINQALERVEIGQDWTPKQVGLRENPGCLDNGDGSLTMQFVHRAFPGVTAKRWTSYARRGEDRAWYEADADPAYHFASPYEALELSWRLANKAATEKVGDAAPGRPGRPATK